MVNEPTKKVSVSIGYLTDLKKENKDLKEEVAVLWRMVRLQMRNFDRYFDACCTQNLETKSKEEQV